MLNLERLAGPELAVVTYDQRGVSRSTSPPLDPANFELLDYVEDLEAVRRAVGAERVHLLGHSWGGIVAMRYATAYPEKVRSIVLTQSGPPTWDGVLSCLSGEEVRFLELQETGVIPRDLTPGTEEYERATLSVKFSDPTFWFSPEDAGGPPSFNQQVGQLTWAAVQGFDLTSLVAGLKHRVLVLWGEDDPCGLSVGESIEEALSAAEVEFVLLRDCGHFWHECPEHFFEHTRAFLELAAAQ
jgi:pimeloyl-ACP methyl ester carboxylesterase